MFDIFYNREQKKQERRKSLAFLLASSAIPSVRLLQGVDLDGQRGEEMKGSEGTEGDGRGLGTRTGMRMCCSH